MRMRIHILFGICLMILLQGCLNVNLKSVLPDQTYYSLDNVVLQPECKKPQEGFALTMSALSPYNSKDILLYNEQKEIKVLPNYKWIDLPKNMTRNAFIKIASNNCLRIEQNPPLSQRIQTLHIAINDLYVIAKDKGYEAHIYLTYEVLGHDMQHLRGGMIATNADHSNPAISLQQAMNDALQKIANTMKGK